MGVIWQSLYRYKITAYNHSNPSDNHSYMSDSTAYNNSNLSEITMDNHPIYITSVRIENVLIAYHKCQWSFNVFNVMCLLLFAILTSTMISPSKHLQKSQITLRIKHIFSFQKICFSCVSLYQKEIDYWIDNKIFSTFYW